MPTLELSPGATKNNATIKTSGAMASLGFLEMNTTPIAPNRAGRMLSKAGFRVGDSSTGRRKPRPNTPKAMTSVVTMELEAMAMVEIASPSSLPGRTLAASMALSAQGTFKLVRLPVTKPR